MGQNSFQDNSATEYGKNFEAVARKLYRMSMKHHMCFKIKPTGLFFNKDNPVLRSSPNGFVSCKCCGTGLLEVKCPHKLSIRNTNPEEVALDGKYHICIESDKRLLLKRSSPWFTKVQSHLLVTGYPWCNFVPFTEKNPHIMKEKIYPQHEFGEMVQETVSFYKKFVFPNLT